MIQFIRQHDLHLALYLHQWVFSLIQNALKIYFGLVNYANKCSQIYLGLGERVL